MTAAKELRMWRELGGVIDASGIGIDNEKLHEIVYAVRTLLQALDGKRVAQCRACYMVATKQGDAGIPLCFQCHAEMVREAKG